MTASPNGRPGPPVSQATEVALGCAGLAGLYSQLEAHIAADTLDCACNAGLRRFDTAPFYGLSLSETRAGDFLRHKPRAEYQLSIEVGSLLRPLGPNASSEAAVRVVFDYSYDGR